MPDTSQLSNSFLPLLPHVSNPLYYSVQSSAADALHDSSDEDKHYRGDASPRTGSHCGLANATIFVTVIELPTAYVSLLAGIQVQLGQECEACLQYRIYRYDSVLPYAMK